MACSHTEILLSYVRTGHFALYDESDHGSRTVRYNHATKDFEKCLDRYGIPYRVLPRPKHELYHHSAVKDILAYLRLAATPAFTPWLLRILRMMDGIEPEVSI